MIAGAWGVRSLSRLPASRTIVRTAIAAAVGLACAATPAPARELWSGNTDPEKDAALIVNAKNGAVFFARNEAEQRHPASLTKMIILYLLFERLHEGKLRLTSDLTVSMNAVIKPRAKIHMHAGSTITVETAIEAIIVCSANDVTVAVAENLGGSEAHFAELMNAKAQALGMKHTFYHNATGLPDDLQLTTASDLAILARHLIYDFPEYFHYFAMPVFHYRGFEFETHDGLIGDYAGADGLKTGYTDELGYNLVSTAQRGGVRLVGVVLGGWSDKRRNREMEKLLDLGFTKSNPVSTAPAARTTN